MQISQNTCQLAVHFLRIRRQLVPCPKSRLHMSYLYLLQERSIAGQEGRQCIAVHEHQIRLSFTKHRLKTLQHTDGDFVKRLPVLHNVQIIIRHNLEYIQHLIQQLTVLRGYADHRVNMLRMFIQFQDKRCHLNGFRTYTEDRHHLYLFSHFPTPFFYIDSCMHSYSLILRCFLFGSV